MLINRLEKIAMGVRRHFAFSFRAIIFSVLANDKTGAILALRPNFGPIFFVICFNFVWHKIKVNPPNPLYQGDLLFPPPDKGGKGDLFLSGAVFVFSLSSRPVSRDPRPPRLAARMAGAAGLRDYNFFAFCPLSKRG